LNTRGLCVPPRPTPYFFLIKSKQKSRAQHGLAKRLEVGKPMIRATAQARILPLPPIIREKAMRNGI